MLPLSPQLGTAFRESSSARRNTGTALGGDDESGTHGQERKTGVTATPGKYFLPSFPFQSTWSRCPSKGLSDPRNMTVTILVHYGALDASALSHPALAFYAEYAAAFAKPVVHYDTDGRVIHGGKALWQALDELFSPFEHEHEPKSWVLISNSDDGTYELHVEIVSTFRLPGRDDPLTIPRFFIYTIAKADEGKGTRGLQHRVLKSFWNRGELEKYKLGR
ncbi:hypothetical protein EXIGLDRAFT_746072 [Exidia glandulosa HHB12029]|uniref:Uncharacterized protein n=1 Tax=Exidia glandulosa HHB12029 TaxID=1314781 RepID=A0A165MRJ0_EXIGL|nr:hypothetical protein EXIGLDRAFT_746072 [Exidia glandulosa HHB12029]